MKCEWCNKEKETYTFEVWDSPWGEPDELTICEECEDTFYDYYDFCEHCGRFIALSNGLRGYIRYYKSLGHICVGCLQNYWFDNGMDREIFENPDMVLDGDFFNYEDLAAHGYKEVENYAYGMGYTHNHGYADVDRCKKKALELIDAGFKVIINIKASGMGLGGYFNLWAR